jgi:hypothetical protein
VFGRNGGAVFRFHTNGCTIKVVALDA